MGILGSLLIIIGNFLPVVKAKVLGVSQTFIYIRVYTLVGILLILLAIISMFISFSGERRPLILTGILSLLLAGFTFVDFLVGKSQADYYRKQIKEIFSPTEDTFDLQLYVWSWIAIFLGSGLCIVEGLGGRSGSKEEMETIFPEEASAVVQKTIRAVQQTFGTFLSQQEAFSLELEAVDAINSSWSPGRRVKIGKKEVKLGRDSSWADVRVGRRWVAVSRRHGIIRIERGRVIYTPISKKYSFAIDGKPYSTPQVIPEGGELALVSGYGPRMRVRLIREG